MWIKVTLYVVLHVYSCLSGVFNSTKNRFLQWEAYATRAFYLNASESIKRHDLSSDGPRQDSSVWVSDPGNILLEWLYGTQAMSCRTYCELHLCVSVVTHQLFLCRVGFILFYSYSFIWQSYHLLLWTTISLTKIIALVFTCYPLHKWLMYCLILHKNSLKLFSYKSSLKLFSYNTLKFCFKRKETWHNERNWRLHGMFSSSRKKKAHNVYKNFLYS